ncbi:MAG: response regulator [Anaerolineae bacterium]|nr:response regulator [Anaerolineae bacterium]
MTNAILLVEDNDMDIVLTLDAFGQVLPEATIHVARNGREALDYLFGAGKYADREQYPLPELILLDLKMPGISGLDVLCQVKDNIDLKRLPVIVLSSSNVDKDIHRSYDLGANSYLVKPIVFDEFIDMVKRIGDYWLAINQLP